MVIALLAKDHYAYTSTGSILTLRPSRADSIRAKIIWTTRRPSVPVADGARSSSMALRKSSNSAMKLPRLLVWIHLSLVYRLADHLDPALAGVP